MEKVAAPWAALPGAARTAASACGEPGPKAVAAVSGDGALHRPAVTSASATIGSAAQAPPVRVPIRGVRAAAPAPGSPVPVTVIRAALVVRVPVVEGRRGR